jgi:hypothetical protein
MEAERRQVTVLFTDVVGLPRCSASRAIVAIRIPHFHDCATYSHLVSFGRLIMIGGSKLCCS